MFEPMEQKTMGKWHGWRKSPITQLLPDSQSPSLYTVIPCCEPLKQILRQPSNITLMLEGHKDLKKL